MEGRNCFRPSWTQVPSYSGGSISSLVVEYAKPLTALPAVATRDSTQPREVLCLPCGDELIVLDSVTGLRLASYQFPDEDIVLNLDTISIMGPLGNANPRQPKNNDDPLAPSPGSFIALSTRALQICVLELRQVVDTVMIKNDATGGEDGEGDGEVPVQRHSDALELRPVRQWTAGHNAIALLLFSSCGRYLVSGTTTGHIQAWNVFHHYLTHSLRFPDMGLLSALALTEPATAAEAPDFLAAANEEGTVAIYSFSTSKKMIASAKIHVGKIVGISMNVMRRIEGGAAAQSSPGKKAKNAAETGGDGPCLDLLITTVGVDRKVVTSRLFYQANANTGSARPFVNKLLRIRAVAIKEYVSCVQFESPSLFHLGSSDGVLASYAIDRDHKTPEASKFLEDLLAMESPEDGGTTLGKASLVRRGTKPMGVDSEDLKDEVFVKSITISALPRYSDRIAAHVSRLEGVSEDSGILVDRRPKSDADATGPTPIYIADGSYTISVYYPLPQGKRLPPPRYVLKTYLEQIMEIVTLPQLIDYNRSGTDVATPPSRALPLAKTSPHEAPRIVATSSKVAYVYGNSGCRTSAVLRGHSDTILAVAMTDCGRLIATAGKDRTVRIWDGAALYQDYCDRSGQGGDAGSVLLRSRRAAQRTSQLQCVAIGAGAVEVGGQGHTQEVGALAFSRLYAGDADDVLHNAKARSILMSAGKDEALVLWDAASAVRRFAAGADGAAPRKGRKGREGREEDETEHGGEPAIEEALLEQFPPVAMEPIIIIHGAHDGGIRCLCASHVASQPATGHFVATGGEDKTIIIWTLSNAKASSASGDGKRPIITREATLRGHKRSINNLVFSRADAQLLLSSSHDGTVKLWSMVSFTLIRSLQYQSAKSPLLQARFFNQGRQIISATNKGLLQFWAISTGECVSVLQRQEDMIWALDVIEDARGEGSICFISGSSDGTLAVTEDFTAEAAQAVRDEHRENVEQEQLLRNSIRHKHFVKAFALSLKMNHPRHLRLVMDRWMADCANRARRPDHNPEEGGPSDMIVGELVREVLPPVAAPLLHRLMGYCREWLTNARNAAVATVILRAVLACYQHWELFGLMTGAAAGDAAGGPSLREMCAPLVAYSTRHTDRISGLLNRLYFIDYVVRADTGALSDGAAGAAGLTTSPSFSRYQAQPPAAKRFRTA